MKNIITALGNPKINEELKEKEECNILSPDIQYQDGVIECLEGNETAEILILNSLLPGERDLQEFINKIKEINFNIEIIIILEKENSEIKNFLISKGIFNIFYNNKITINEIVELLKENKIPDEINEEIKLLKEMILKNQIKKEKRNKTIKNIKSRLIKIISNKKTDNIKSAKNKILVKKNNSESNINKIISIIGAPGTGKTIISCILSETIKSKKKLLIDFDFLNNNISTIFGTNKTPKTINQQIKENKIDLNKIEIKDLIIKANNNLDLICGLEILLKNKTDININKIKNNINELSEKYDLIIIDTSSDINNTYLKQIIEKSNQAILIIEPNLLGIKSSQRLLEKYINKWQIKKEKINILFNKKNINSISEVILKQLFSDFRILGQIKLNKEYDLIINKNKVLFGKQIKKEYLKIINKMNLN